MKAYYHSIETFGTVDGQGIRYVLFLAGCSLGCVFCHNPDTWSCGEKVITISEILADYQKYCAFYDASGGGITVSGGEPLLQADFVAELFKACREAGIHTTLDTAGYCTQESVLKVIPYTDAVLFSIKAVTAEQYRFLTVADNTAILANLRLFAAHIPLTLRYVLIPGITDSISDLAQLADLIKTLPSLVPVELLAYHTLGREKWLKLGLKYGLEEVPDATNAQMARAKSQLEAQGIRVLFNSLG